MRRVIIADAKSFSRNGKSTGHYFTVADNYLEVFYDKCKVIVAGGPLYKERYKELIELPYDTTPQSLGLVNKARVVMNLFFMFKQLREDDVLVLQSNAVATTFFALSFYRRKNPIYMIQYNQMGLDSGVKKWLFSLAKKKINGIICPDTEIGAAYCDNYCVVPDYIMTEKQFAKLNEGWLPKKYDFGMLGIITEDKGVVEAAKQLVQTDYSVLIAGRPANEAIREKLVSICQGKKNISLILDYVSDDDYDRYIREVKYCILNYSDAYSEHSSGVIFDTLYRGTPVIGRRCKFLQVVEENKIGYLCDDISECDFEQLLSEGQVHEYQDNLRKYLKQQVQVGNKLNQFLR